VNFIKDILATDGGAAGFVIGILGLAFWVVNKISNISANHSSFSDNVNDIKSDVRMITTDVATLHGSLTAIIASNNPLTQRQSPINLTKKGNEIAEELDAIQMIANNWDIIYKKLKNELNSKNAYDIQQFCISKGTNDLSYFLKDGDIEKVKLDAYNRGLTLNNYGGLIGVLIRDKYFNIEKIPLGDVDKHDPEVKTDTESV
jgi:hypothetical protein